MSVEELRDELDIEQEDVENTESSEIDDDTDDLNDDDDEDDDDDDNPEPETKDDDEDSDDDVLGFSFDDEGEGEDSDGDPFAGKPAPDWVKQLRKENRELKRQVREREAQQQNKALELREKPTLAAYEYDSEAYEADLQKWFAEKQEYDQKIKSEEERLKRYEDRYVKSVDAMRAKAPDYDEVEETIVDVLPPQRQAMIKVLVENPALMAYTLGKSPKTLDELSKLDDIQFTKQIVLMEQKMAKAKSRNPDKPKPKNHDLTGSTGGGDTQLAKLEAEAARTGDRSKVVQYKRQQRNKT